MQGLVDVTCFHLIIKSVRSKVGTIISCNFFDPKLYATFHVTKTCSWLDDAHEKTWLKLVMHILKRITYQPKRVLSLLLKSLNLVSFKRTWLHLCYRFQD